MKQPFSKLGLVLSGAYLSLYAAMMALAIYTLVTRTATSEFSGIGLILVTFPWSLLWVAGMEHLGVIRWYEQFSGAPALYGVMASLVLLPAALPYVATLYYVGRYIEKLRTNR